MDTLAEVGGRSFYYEDTGGQGVPLVFSHGFLMDHEMFEPQVRALGERHRVITWDQRGHGRTGFAGEPFTYWDSAEDLAGLLDVLGVRRAVLAGHSQGGFVSQRLALSHPERVAGLVMIDSQGGTEDPDRVQTYDVMRDAWVQDGPTEILAGMVAALIIGEWDRTAEWTSKWLRLPPEAIVHIYDALVTRDDVWDRLPEIHVPALVIHGAEDASIEVEKARRMRELLNAGMVVVPGAGHAPNLTHPEPVNEAIAAFLTEIPPPV